MNITREPPRTTEALSSFNPDRRDLPNQILETSGEHVLVHLLADEDAPLAVADRTSKTLVRLKGPSSAAADHAHLTPGGDYVLVEELSPGPRPAKTGALRLYDARTGTAIKSMTEPQVVKLPFRGISPTGVVLFTLGDRNHFVDLGMRFPARPVFRLSLDEFPQPSVFFADR